MTNETNDFFFTVYYHHLKEFYPKMYPRHWFALQDAIKNFIEEQLVEFLPDDEDTPTPTP